MVLEEAEKRTGSLFRNADQEDPFIKELFRLVRSGLFASGIGEKI